MPGGGQTQNKVENKDPWAPAQPYLQQIMGQGANLYNQGAGSQTWGGPLTAPLSSQTRYGISNLTDTARALQPNAAAPANYGTGVIQSGGLNSGYDKPMGIYGDVAQAAGQPTASAQNLGGMASGADAGQNPYLLQMLQDNTDRIGNRVASQMSGMGRYGSFGHGDALARSITSANAPILSSAYENDRNRMLQASGQIDASNAQAANTQMGAAQGLTGIQNFGQQNAANWASMMPQLQQSAFMPSNQLLAAGNYMDQYDQRTIDAQRQLFEQQQNMPWTQLAKYSGALQGTAPWTANAGTTTGNIQQEKQLGFQDFAQMLAGGSNSAAAGGANAASAILGLLSDRNEKTDIKKLGTDEETGLGIYAYRYKGDPKTYPKIVGPMAQEVAEKFPGSTEKVGGKLYVRPEAFGILALVGKKAA
jgi:hypothetical protein